MNIVCEHIHFVAFFPQAKDKIGEGLLANGNFITIWATIIAKNKCVNNNMLCKHIN